MKKIIMLSGGFLGITTIVILFSRINPTTKLNDSVVYEATNNRIIYLEDSKLINEYNQYLLNEKKESELEQKKIKEVKNVVVKTQATEGKSTKNTTNEKKVKSNRWGIRLTENEIDLLARIVVKEAGGQSDVGEQAVIEVVFNRMIHKKYKGSLYEVLSKDGQFESWKYRNEVTTTKKEFDNIKKVLNGETLILSSEYVYFSRGKQNDCNPVKIGDHWFCEYER